MPGPSPAPPPPAAPAPAASTAPTSLPIQSRRTVTMLFCDVSGSTAMGERLDPETTRQVMSRYFDAIRDAVVAHGGTVEKFIGDAVMAAFGIPVIHEDDALRAVRAAADMRLRLHELEAELIRDWGVKIQARTGINTGEVVAGDVSTGSTFATGDTVNVAARLEQACPPGEVYIGDSTYRLVRDAVTVEPVEPLTLKGKAEPVPAYRLVDVAPDAPGLARRLESPIVGRAAEVGQLLEAFDAAVAAAAVQLVTVVGPAGAGKSRLTKEFLETVAGRSTVLQGRFIPYGEGITYFPLQLIVKGLAGIEDGESREQAREKLGRLLPESDEASLVCARLAGAIGLDEVLARPEEIAWAVRRLFETLAEQQPLVAVFDDIHWAEPTFLNLIEYVGGFSRGRPILLLCNTRPDLADGFPNWGQAVPATRTITLAPLDERECVQLVDNLLGEDVAAEVGARVVAAAEGNPLFVEELLRMLVDDGLLRRVDDRWELTGDADEVPIPPSIEALIAARLDHLDPDERAVLQRAAVIGRVFGWDAVSFLSPPEERGRVGALLQSLMRKELVAPDAGAIGGEDAFRFGHILTRDAAYRGIPKETRSTLHESFATFLEERAGDRANEYEEIIGYHLEQAYLQQAGLGPIGEAALRLRDRACRRLSSAGHRALLRGDLPAAVNLFERASALAPEGGERVDLLVRLGGVQLQLGQLEEAEALLSTALEQAEAAGDLTRAARCEIGREFVRLQTDPDGRSQAIAEITGRAMPLFRESGDELGLARSFRLRSEVDRLACRFGDEATGLTRALEHARRAGEEREAAEIQTWLGTSLVYGPIPVGAAIARCRQMLDQARGVRWIEASILGMLAYLEAMHDRADEGRALYARSRAIYEELGMTFALVARAVIPAGIESMGGDLEAAERELLAGYSALERIGEKELRSTIAATLAHTVYGQGRDDEAESFSRISEETAAADDVGSQVLWRGARAKVLARRDGDPSAEALALEGVALAAATDCLSLHGAALLDVAEVQILLGRRPEALDVVDEAVALLARKEDLATQRRAQLLVGEGAMLP